MCEFELTSLGSETTALPHCVFLLWRQNGCIEPMGWPGRMEAAAFLSWVLPDRIYGEKKLSSPRDLQQLGFFWKFLLFHLVQMIKWTNRGPGPDLWARWYGHTCVLALCCTPGFVCRYFKYSPRFQLLLNELHKVQPRSPKHTFFLKQLCLRWKESRYSLEPCAWC